MASRFYLPLPIGCDKAAAPVSPTFDAAWGDTSVALRAKTATRAFNTPRYNLATISETSTSAHNFLSTQYVSDPLAAQTISGTVKGIIPSRENSTNANACAQLVIRVVSNDGTTFRGTLLAANDSAVSSEFATTSPVYVSRKFPRGWTGAGGALSSVAAQAGDRLVIEVGPRFDNVSGTALSVQFALGDDAGLTDAPEDETSADLTHRAWLEFSQTLVFAPTYTPVTVTLSSGASAASIIDAGLDTDIVYLNAGTYNLGAYTQTTVRNKWLRIRPAPGVSRDSVVFQSATQDLTNANWLSFEGIKSTASFKPRGHHIGFVGCELVGVNIQAVRHLTISDGINGGSAGAPIESYAILFGVTLGSPWIQDVWIQRNSIGYVHNVDCIEARNFDHLVVEDNEFHDLTRDVGAHTDAFRTFLSASPGVHLGGRNLVFRRNHLVSGYNGQGFFINGGNIHDLLIEQNLFGNALGSFRAFAVDDSTDRMRIINNSFQEGGSFSDDSLHTNVVMFNNAFEAGDSIGIVAGTTVDWAYRDYNYLGEDPTGVTPAANEPIDGVTFTDAANGDYMLTAGSNGLNFGIASAIGVFAPTTDKNGVTRAFPCEAGALER